MVWLCQAVAEARGKGGTVWLCQAVASVSRLHGQAELDRATQPK